MDTLKIQSEKVAVHKKVDESFAALRNLYPKNITLENNVSEKIIASADPNILNLVLRNLVLNAIKFTQNGGRVWVNATETTQDITVAISDNGIGISKEVKEKLFNKASTYSTRGTANEKGTGIGLILCKEFVEKNGGKIWLESEVGKGTSFYFTLPKAS
jgi:signal transduction histidine kinase